MSNPTRAAPGRVLVVLLLGVYYAATDGILMAMVSSAVPRRLRTSGLAVVATATSLARFTAAIAFGLLWLRYGSKEAVGAFGIGLCVMVPFALALPVSLGVAFGAWGGIGVPLVLVPIQWFRMTPHQRAQVLGRAAP